MNNLFYELAGVLIFTGIIALVVNTFKQPSIIAYIVAGLLLSAFGYYQTGSAHAFQSLAEVGITLLLFMVGLELDVTQLKRLGKTAAISGVLQVLLTGVLGFLVLRLLGMAFATSLFMAMALAFSSTIIVVKLLSEKRDLQSLYGKIAVGILLVQDIVAIFLLIILASISPSGGGIYSGLAIWENILMTVIRGLILILIIAWLSREIFPKVLHKIGKNDELLLIFSLAWALGLATFVSLPLIGFNLEIGGFLAGLALAGSAVHYQISAKIKSIRDFFIIIFFIVLGSQMAVSDIRSMLWPLAAMSAFVIVVKPLIVMGILSVMGYKPRTSFLSGTALAQVSEFSLILIALGFKMGAITKDEAGLVTIVGVLSIIASSYMVTHSQNLVIKAKWLLKFFDFRKGVAEKDLNDVQLKNHIILVGAHRMGRHLVDSLKKQDYPYVIVDFNPEIVEKYLEENRLAICGDITDPFIQDEVNLEDARLIISTIPDLNDNMALVDAVRRKTADKRRKPRLIFSAQDEKEAESLYDQQIDYVISPHFMSGQHLAQILEDENGFRSLKKLREHHLRIMGR